MALKIKQGEAKTITFTIVDADGVAVDCSSTVCSFKVALTKGATPIITKADAVFDKTNAALGILTVDISETDSDQDPEYYISELDIIFTETNIDKSKDISFVIQEAV